MTDELGRPPHNKPATTKTDSTAPIIDPALEPETTGRGLHDHPGTPPSKAEPDPKLPA